MNRPPITFVTPWYGADLRGGAEIVCRQLAEHLADSGYPVEVLTTCARGFQYDWDRSYYRPGQQRMNGVTVRRFRASPRDNRVFSEVNRRLMRGTDTSEGDEALFLRNTISSDELCRYLALESTDRRPVFIPYLFGTTYWGVRAVSGNAYMIPCLHDEGYAHMRAFQALMPTVRGFLVLSRAERDLLRRLYDLPMERLHLTGAGVDTQSVPNAERFRQKYGINQPFLLYVGRREPGKNTPLLLDYFRRMKAERGWNLQLLLIGSGALPSGALVHPDIVDLGELDDQTKGDAMGAALCLVNPSRNESFSLVLMESWVAGRPVLVHSECAVTTEHCLSAHGGLMFGNYDEFAAAVRWLRTNPEHADILGRQGRQYVLSNFSWDRVVSRVASVLNHDAAR